MLGFIGLSDIRFVRVGFDEFQDGRREQALAAAEAAVDRLVGELTGRMVAEEAASARGEVGGGSWSDVRETPARSS